MIPNSYSQKGGDKMNEEKTQDQNQDKDIQENKVVAALGYIGVLCLIPLLAKKDSKYAQFHGKQGLILFIVEIIAFVIGIIPILGWLIGFIFIICCIILSIIGIIKSLSGEYWKMPVLGQYAEKINL